MHLSIIDLKLTISFVKPFIGEYLIYFKIDTVSTHSISKLS